MRTAPEAQPADVRVVVVDDNPFFRAVAQDVIEATAGFVGVAFLGSGEEAVREVEHCDADLVLMDVRLPGMDGPAAARLLGRLPRPPIVVLLSADERPDIAEDPAAHGAADFFHKHAFGPRLLRRLGPSPAPVQSVAS